MLYRFATSDETKKLKGTRRIPSPLLGTENAVIGMWGIDTMQLAELRDRAQSGLSRTAAAMEKILPAHPKHKLFSYVHPERLSHSNFDEIIAGFVDKSLMPLATISRNGKLYLLPEEEAMRNMRFTIFDHSWGYTNNFNIRKIWLEKMSGIEGGLELMHKCLPQVAHISFGGSRPFEYRDADIAYIELTDKPRYNEIVLVNRRDSAAVEGWPAGSDPNVVYLENSGYMRKIDGENHKDSHSIHSYLLSLTPGLLEFLREIIVAERLEPGIKNHLDKIASGHYGNLAARLHPDISGTGFPGGNR